MTRPDSTQAVKRSGRLSLRRLSAYIGACLGALALAVALLILVFGGAILNGYGRAKAERAFAKAHPRCALRIGKLDYALGVNRLAARSVTLIATNTTFTVDRVSLTGTRWVRLLRGTAALADVLAQASLDATNLDVQFPQARYGLRCARLRASAPGSELIAEGTTLPTLVGDEEFFAAHPFRTTRFHVVVPECSWAWRMASCSRESRTEPDRSALPSPPSMRWSIVTSQRRRS